MRGYLTSSFCLFFIFVMEGYYNNLTCIKEEMNSDDEGVDPTRFCDTELTSNANPNLEENVNIGKETTDLTICDTASSDSKTLENEEQSRELASLVASCANELKSIQENSEISEEIRKLSSISCILAPLEVKPPKPRPLQCTGCEYRAVDSATLKRHYMARHSLERPLKCSECDYRTVHSGTLNRHILARHTTQRPLACTQCEYRAIDGATLRRHIAARHLLEKPLKCPQCSYGTVHSGTLKRHVLSVHSNQKKVYVKKRTYGRPLKCPDCDYITGHSGTLKRHILARHTAERPLGCSECDYRAVDGTSLRKHFRAKHCPDNPLKCPICEYKTVHTGTLNRHVLTMHTSMHPICEFSILDTTTTKNGVTACPEVQA